MVPEFATFNTRTVIPDQSELDQVDESALNRGHKEILVDKDDETLTEVIQSEFELNWRYFMLEEPIIITKLSIHKLGHNASWGIIISTDEDLY